jgi:phosphoribosyl-dephospho-CoA transferase
VPIVFFALCVQNRKCLCSVSAWVCERKRERDLQVFEPTFKESLLHNAY